MFNKWNTHWIDKSIYSRPWRQILALFALAIFIILIFAIVVQCVDDDKLILYSDAIDNTEEVTFSEKMWQVYYYFADPGNQMQMLSNPRGRWIAMLISVCGSIFLSSLLISTISNIISRRVDNYKYGFIHYHMSDHVVIIGYNSSAVSVIKTLIADAKYGCEKILLLSDQNINEIRTDLFTHIERKYMSRIIMVHGKRNNYEDVKHLYVTRAKEIYVVGEKDEYDHDSLNMDCVKLVDRIYREKDKDAEKGKKNCYVLFENQNTFTILQDTNISDDKYITFIPLSFYEMWARKVLLPAYNENNDNLGVIPQRLDYRPITYTSEDTVHFVIVGMSRIGEALAKEAALIAHFPNFVRDNSKKTRITIIDSNADVCMQRLRGKWRNLLDVAKLYYIDATQIDKSMVVAPDYKGEEQHRTSRYAYLGDFLDVEFTMVKGDVESPNVQRLIKRWAKEKDTLMSVAVCFNYPPATNAIVMRLPDAVYDNNIPIYARQETSYSVVEMMSKKAKYRNIRPFGMLYDSFDLRMKNFTAAKCVNFIYDAVYDYLDKNKPLDADYKKAAPNNIDISVLDEKWNGIGVNVKKWSNIYNANTIDTKLRSVGIEPNDDRELTDNEVAIISQVEHNRWNLEELMIGYSPATIEQKEEIDNNKALKEVYKKERFIHYDICQYKDLATDQNGVVASIYDECLTVCLPLIKRTIKDM